MSLNVMCALTALVVLSVPVVLTVPVALTVPGALVVSVALTALVVLTVSVALNVSAALTALVVLNVSAAFITVVVIQSYPGDRTGGVVDYNATVEVVRCDKSLQRAEVGYEGRTIYFYKLKDGRGYIHGVYSSASSNLSDSALWPGNAY